MTEVSYGWIILFNVVLFGGIFVGATLLVLAFMVWRRGKQMKDNIVAEIWQNNGLTVRNARKPNEDGITVDVKGCTYVLPQEKEESGGRNPIHPRTPPAKRFLSWPRLEIFGFRLFPMTLRIVSWEEGNPEPVSPFYGVFVKEGKDKDGNKTYTPCEPEDDGAKFIGNRLMITAGQLNAIKTQVQALAVAKKVADFEARWKVFERALANIPNKMILYLLCFLAAAGAVISIVIQLRGG